jgi:hypothetical protein
MKRFALLAASLLFTAGLALAQDTTTTPAASAPDSTAPGTAPAPDTTPAPAEKGKRVMSPEMREIHDRIKLQEDRIAAGVKNGKLTADEAAALTAKLKSIREEIKSDWTQNKASGQKGLTGDQKAQIKSELEANSAAIKDDKQDATATPAN